MPKRSSARRVTRTRAMVMALVVSIAAVTAQTGAQPGAAAGPADLAQNFDIRLDKSVPGAADYLERAAAGFATARDQRLAARAEGLARLMAGDAVSTALSPEFNALEIVSVRTGRQFLTPPSVDRVAALRVFLTQHASAFGVSPDQVNALELVADYENPSGNMAWVEFEQKINGVPVFRGTIRGGFTARGELVGTTGQLATDLEGAALPTMPAISAVDAVARAAAHVGWPVAGAALVTAAVEDGGRRVTVAGGALAGEATAWQVYFPIDSGVARLAWATQIVGDPDAYLLVLDAEDGTVLFRKNLVEYQTQSVTYNVYNADSPAPSTPHTGVPGANTQAPYIARQTLTLIGNEAPNTFNNLGWITDGGNTTAGNNVIAGQDLVSPDGIEAPVTGSALRVFNFAYNPEIDAPTTANYRSGDVVNMFYWTNRYHDELYRLGFTEAARNFQNDNFGRGGTGNDRVLAEGQDFSGSNNANFFTPADGQSGRMQMYLWSGPTPDRSGNLDNEIIIHELTHGLSNRLHSNAVGLSNNMSRGMGEGWSDFFARALLSDGGEPVTGIYAMGGWATHLATTGYVDNYYYGIRRFPYAMRSVTGGPLNRPHNPLTFADVDPTQINLTDGAFARGPFGAAQADGVHNMGEVWASALFEVRARFITRLGWATGNQRIMQFVVDGMKLDPPNPTFLQARDSIIAAANASGTAADVADIWAGFAARGMGTLAQVLNTTAGATSVVENFSVPGEPTPTFSINDVSVAEGQSGTTSAIFTVTLANPNASESRVSFATSDGTATTGGGTHTSSGAITIPTVGSASPYPAQLAVAGVVGTVSRLQVRLNSLSHTFPADLDVLLVGPGGQRTILMSDAGGTGDLINATLTFDDSGPALTTGTITPGTYAPTDLEPGDSLPVPAPPAPYVTSLAAFNGTNPNGTWSLYVADDLSGDTGSLASFSLIISTTAGDYVPAAGLLTFPVGTTTRTINVAVNGDTTPEPNETFHVTLSGAVNGVIGDGTGVGTVLDDDNVSTPTTVDDSYSTPFNTALAVAAPGVLANDNSNGGGAMTAALVSGPTSGSLTLNTSGAFTYTPAAGFVGNASFTYRAANSGGPGNVATVTVSIGGPTTPQPPTNLYVDSVVGNLVTLRWTAATIGPAADGFVLEGGLTPGSVLASLPTGSAAPIFTVVAPSGSFFVRIHQLSGAARSAASNEVPLHVNVPVPPSAPSSLVASVNGASLDLAWRNTFGGGPPSSLILDVSGAISASLPLGLTEHISFPAVPGGTYTMAVRAANGGGASAPSNSVTMTIPATCTGAPSAPANFLFYKAGDTARATWDPAASGNAPTSYIVNVSGPIALVLPTTAREVAGVPPPGAYSMNVVAVNACGSSAPTATQTISVP